MRKCRKCGRNVESKAEFCPFCGACFERHRKQHTSAFERMDIQNHKLLAALAYMGILVLIPLFAARESKYVRFHARQGLLLLIAEIIFSVCYCILSFIVLSVSWHLYFIVRITRVVGYVFFVLAVIGISNAVSGKVTKLPVIGNILDV